MKNLGILLCVLMVAIFSGWNASAQEIAGSIRGTVLDASGAVVSNAAVTATRTETRLARTVYTDASDTIAWKPTPRASKNLFKKVSRSESIRRPR